MPGAGGRGNWESEFNGNTVSVGENETVLEMDGGKDCTTVYLTQLNYMLKNGKFCFIFYFIIYYLYISQ